MYVSRDMRGNWCATTTKQLTDKLRLNLRTAKNYSGQLVTTASVCTIDGIWGSYGVCEDFSVTLERTEPKHITSKVVEQQHSKHDIEQIALEAIAFYKEKEDAKES